MGLSTPSFRPSSFTAECSSPAVISGSQIAITWDTYYDTSSSEIEALPAACGLSTDNQIFTATVSGLFAFWAGFSVAASPGHSGKMLLALPDYGFSAGLDVPHPNVLGDQLIGRLVWLGVGDTVSLVEQGTAGDLLISYATLTVIRLA